MHLTLGSMSNRNWNSKHWETAITAVTASLSAWTRWCRNDRHRPLAILCFMACTRFRLLFTIKKLCMFSANVITPFEMPEENCTLFSYLITFGDSFASKQPTFVNTKKVKENSNAFHLPITATLMISKQMDFITLEGREMKIFLWKAASNSHIYVNFSVEFSWNYSQNRNGVFRFAYSILQLIISNWMLFFYWLHFRFKIIAKMSVNQQTRFICRSKLIESL